MKFSFIDNVTSILLKDLDGIGLEPPRLGDKVEFDTVVYSVVDILHNYDTWRVEIRLT